MGRLSEELRSRTESFADRMLDVVDTLELKRSYSRILDQMVGAGTSVGANICEADQAVSRPDFAKCLGIAVKELAECQYWLRVCVRRGWLPDTRLAPLQLEAEELAKIFNAMITRTRRARKS